MAHFARIEDGVVQQVMAVADNAINGGKFPNSEALGQAMLAESGFDGLWMQCSYSESFRGRYPGIGDHYDGTTFSRPPQAEAAVAAYERGKADGEAQALAAYRAEQVI